MDRKSRRNSILKPSLNQETFVDYEEEITENFTFSRRKSMKRVSFAGRDEVKEFQKHEALTVEKLEKALSQIQNDSGIKETECNFPTKLDIQTNPETDKENLRKSVILSHIPPTEDDMEITTTTSVFSNIQQLTMLQPVEMDLSSNSLPEVQVPSDAAELNQTAHDAEQFADISKEMDLSTQEIRTVEMTDKTVCSSPATKFVLSENEKTTIINKEMEISYQDMETVEKNGEMFCSSTSVHIRTSENETKEVQMTIDEVSTVFDHTALASQKVVHCDISIKDVECVPVDIPKAVIPYYYDESSEFSYVSKAYGWSVTRNENELSMMKLCDSFTLKFLLGNEYLNHNFRHFVIEEVEVDTNKEMPSKWARFGLTVLENTVDSCDYKSVCSSTEDLAKFLRLVQEHIDIFQQFMFEDSSTFELMTNPRSLQVDIENMKLSFELSNLENLLLIQVTLTLNPIFPLSAKDVAIVNVIGKANKTELSNMISTISPSGQYLTRVAECIEDFLKFQKMKNDYGVFRSDKEL